MPAELPPYSVVVPVFNGARYVRRAVESAAAQTIPAAEILVVDDGSTDGGAGLVAGHPRVRVLTHAVNKGLPAARNTGIVAARTGLVALLDSDDCWDADKMAAQLPAFAARADVAVAFCDFRAVDVVGVPVGWQGGTRDRVARLGLGFEPIGGDASILVGSTTEALIRETSFMHPSSVVARRSAFDAVGLFDESYPHGEDLEMWLRLSTWGRTAYVDRNLVTIEVRPDSMGHQTAKLAKYLTDLYATLPGRFPDAAPETKRAVAAFLRRECAGLAWHHRERGELALARDYYRRSLAAGWSLRTLAGYLRSYTR